MTNIDGYTLLANAIVAQAAKDYKDNLLLLHKNPNDKKAQAERRKLEKFFRSSWFDILTQLDGEVLLQKLQQTVREEVA